MHVSLLLVNNFLISTTNFINQFSETVEKKISGISTKVTELEILLAVLEAKLNSIPGLEFSSADLPPMQQSNGTSHAPSPSPAGPGAAPAPPPTSSSATAAAAAVAAPAAAPAEVKPAGVAAKDHPDYAAFFKMLRVGVPQQVVAGKMTAAGFNAAILDNPEAMVDEGSSSGVVAVVPSSSQVLTAPPPPPPAAPAPETTEETAPAPAPVPTPAPAAADENPQYEVYRRMKRMLPEGPVRQKMSNDGCTDEEIDRFFSS